jgi:hypothetical protein
MIAFFVQRESDTRAMVLNIHYKPKTLSSDKLSGAILVESKLEPVEQAKKLAVLYVNPQTLKQWYEYVDRPATTEEKLADMSTELAVLKILAACIVPKWSGKNVAYEKKDIVRLNNGWIYKCLADHTSADIYKPSLYPLYWVLLVQV